MARQVLFGIGFHGAWASMAPAKVKDKRAQRATANAAEAAAECDLDWHVIHAQNVQKSHEYFFRSDTASNLILLLMAIGIPERIMIWLMKHQNARRRAMTPYLPSQEASEFGKNNIEVLLQFVQPRTSPV